MLRRIGRTGDVVPTMLQEAFDDVATLPDGTWSVSRGTARVFVIVQDRGARSLVRLDCPLVRQAAATPELFEYVATNADRYLFGHLSCRRTDEGSADVFLTHVLLADHLQAEELTSCVEGLLGTADQLDGVVAERFGGAVFHPLT